MQSKIKFFWTELLYWNNLRIDVFDYIEIINCPLIVLSLIDESKMIFQKRQIFNFTKFRNYSRQSLSDKVVRNTILATRFFFLNRLSIIYLYTNHVFSTNSY